MTATLRGALALSLLVPIAGCAKAARIDAKAPAPLYDSKPVALPQATVLDTDDQPMPDAKLSWAVIPPELATVETGRLVPGHNGDGKLVARVKGSPVELALPLVVRVIDALDVEVVPANGRVRVGEKGTVRGAARYRGALVDGVTASYTSSDPARLTVKDNGDFEARAAGVAEVTVKVGARVVAQKIVINPKPDRLQITCEIGGAPVTPSGCFAPYAGMRFPIDAHAFGEGIELTDPRPTITSADPGVVAVDPRGGVQSINKGVTTLKVTAGDVSMDVIATVLSAKPPPVAANLACTGQFKVPVEYVVMSYTRQGNVGWSTETSRSSTPGMCQDFKASACMEGFIDNKKEAIPLDMLRSIGTACCCKF